MSQFISENKQKEKKLIAIYRYIHILMTKVCSKVWMVRVLTLGNGVKICGRAK